MACLTTYFLSSTENFHICHSVYPFNLPRHQSHYRQSNKFSADIFQLNIRSLVSNLAASFKMWTSSTSRFKEWITVNDLITPGAFI